MAKGKVNERVIAVTAIDYPAKDRIERAQPGEDLTGKLAKKELDALVRHGAARVEITEQAAPEGGAEA